MMLIDLQDPDPCTPGVHAANINSYGTHVALRYYSILLQTGYIFLTIFNSSKDFIRVLTQSRRWRPNAWCGMRILDGRIHQLDGTTVRVVNFSDHSTCLDYEREYISRLARNCLDLTHRASGLVFLEYRLQQHTASRFPQKPRAIPGLSSVSSCSRLSRLSPHDASLDRCL